MPASPAPEQATCAVLTEFLHRFLSAAKTNATDFLADSELTLSQLKVLFTLGHHDGPMSVNEIAERIHLSLAATGRTVDKLVGATLVDRREDQADRRVKRISLTSAGQRFIDSERAVKDDTVARFVSTLPADVGEQLRAALDLVVHADTDYFAECTRGPRTA
ncbi:MarR family transcriptional regulator [Gordonia amarae]|uniref:MarR family transcriptional regulator n=1 Tax=Gordonia amarae TaxID=36821 RepID=A0A857MQM8_9ACTN|nr:MarR family transcriptional regulator [Gordonia amarae]QHN24129.1 MarR family transcriptional regulator [Gordonia amarae]QHN33045.1 MarR family transcriptional regulator [Gordonia amarae]QHN41767.1 MarR family transcriptional regulator [Gordonia amarae]